MLSHTRLHISKNSWQLHTFQPQVLCFHNKRVFLFIILGVFHTNELIVFHLHESKSDRREKMKCWKMYNSTFMKAARLFFIFRASLHYACSRIFYSQVPLLASTFIANYFVKQLLSLYDKMAGVLCPNPNPLSSSTCWISTEVGPQRLHLNVNLL